MKSSMAFAEEPGVGASGGSSPAGLGFLRFDARPRLLPPPAERPGEKVPCCLRWKVPVFPDDPCLRYLSGDRRRGRDADGLFAAAHSTAVFALSPPVGNVVPLSALRASGGIRRRLVHRRQWRRGPTGCGDPCGTAPGLLSCAELWASCGTSACSIQPVLSSPPAAAERYFPASFARFCENWTCIRRTNSPLLFMF